MSDSMNRRTFVAVSSVAFAGCSSAFGSENEEKSYSVELIEDAGISDYTADLEDRGIDVDSTKEIGGDASLMFYRDSSPEEQLKTIGLSFVPYRVIVNQMISITGLESADSRHGVGYIAREWAEQYANGDLSKDEYLSKVEGSYDGI